MKTHILLPRIVNQWCMLYEAWIVGSSVNNLLKGTKIKSDVDVIIPPKHWNDAMKLVNPLYDIQLNSFGGIKIQTASLIIDVWPSNMEDFFTDIFSNKPKQALRLKPYTHLKQQ